MKATHPFGSAQGRGPVGLLLLFPLLATLLWGPGACPFGHSRPVVSSFRCQPSLLSAPSFVAITEVTPVMNLAAVFSRASVKGHAHSHSFTPEGLGLFTDQYSTETARISSSSVPRTIAEPPGLSTNFCPTLMSKELYCFRMIGQPG